MESKENKSWYAEYVVIIIAILSGYISLTTKLIHIKTVSLISVVMCIWLSWAISKKEEIEKLQTKQD